MLRPASSSGSFRARMSSAAAMPVPDRLLAEDLARVVRKPDIAKGVILVTWHSGVAVHVGRAHVDEAPDAPSRGGRRQQVLCRPNVGRIKAAPGSPIGR